MVTFRITTASDRRMLCTTAARLIFSTAAVSLTLAAGADAQARRAHLSNDLQRYLDSGDSTGTTVIVSGSAEQVAAIAARHGLRVRKPLTSGAVLDGPAGRLEEVAADADVPQLSADRVMRGQMAVTDTAIGADQVWDLTS